jgi:antitoxin ParD1/3/4
LLLEGLASGNAVEATPAFWSDLRKEAAQLLAAQSNKKSP